MTGELGQPGATSFNPQPQARTASKTQKFVCLFLVRSLAIERKNKKPDSDLAEFSRLSRK